MLALCTTIYPVEDLAAAKAWFAEYFGVAPYFDEPFFVGFDIAGYELGLMPASETVRPGTDGSESLWGVADIQAAYERALAMGATTLVAPWNTGEGIWVASVRDPFGNRLGLIENPHFVVPPKGAVVVATSTSQLANDAGVRGFSCTATFDGVTPARVFAAWTDAAALGRWFGIDARMTLRIGGPFEIYFLPAEAPARGSEGCHVLSWIPDQMLSFTWNAPPTLPYARAHRTWVVVQLDAVASGTRVTVTHTGFPNAGFDGPDAHPEWPQAWAYFQAAWPKVLEALGREVMG